MGIITAPPLPFGVEFASPKTPGSQIIYQKLRSLTGVINVGVHKTILSDAILLLQSKEEKILSDKIPYV